MIKLDRTVPAAKWRECTVEEFVEMMVKERETKKTARWHDPDRADKAKMERGL